VWGAVKVFGGKNVAFLLIGIGATGFVIFAGELVYYKLKKRCLTKNKKTPSSASEPAKSSEVGV